MENLKINDNLPNTKEWANTATRILRDLIYKHNIVVDRLIQAELKISELTQNKASNPTPNPEHCDSKPLCEDRILLKSERCNYAMPDCKHCALSNCIYLNNGGI